jgi:hypothetical protein
MFKFLAPSWLIPIRHPKNRIAPNAESNSIAVRPCGLDNQIRALAAIGENFPK